MVPESPAPLHLLLEVHITESQSQPHSHAFGATALQALELLQSTGVPNQAVSITTPSELQPLASPLQVDSSAPADQQRTTPPSTSRAVTPGKGSGAGGPAAKSAGKSAGPRAASATVTKAAQTAAANAAAAALAAAGGAGASAAPEAPAAPLAGHISSIINASKQEVEAAAKSYYSAKVCCTCYGTAIPGDPSWYQHYTVCALRLLLCHWQTSLHAIKAVLSGMACAKVV